MATESITIEGKRYVVIPREEYDRLSQAAKLPQFPESDKNGNYPAVAYARASIARSIIRDRTKLGLNQRELAKRSGIRVETLNRIETGKHTPIATTVEKIDRALKRAAGRQSRKRKR